MPHVVKHMCDIKERYCVCSSVYLLNCRVTITKYNCVLGMIYKLFMMVYSADDQFFKNFREARILIDLYEEGLSGGLPGFGITIMIESFHCVGK